MDRHYFLLRRLHSLSGIVPVGLFVIAHLFTNFQMWPALLGKESTFQHEVSFIHGLPALLVIEIVLWASIAFHAILGVYYTFTGRANSRHYPYMDNWRYTLQRWTGMIALAFIFLHVATLRWGWTFGGFFKPFYLNGNVDGTEIPLAHASTALSLQASWIIVVGYVVGVAAVVYHWCNGLWTAAITWGLTTTAPAQRRWGMVCLGLAVLLSIFSIGAIAGALAYDVSEQERAAIEQLDASGASEGFLLNPDGAASPE